MITDDKSPIISNKKNATLDNTTKARVINSHTKYFRESFLHEKQDSNSLTGAISSGHSILHDYRIDTYLLSISIPRK